jgi:hypothetical protein
LPKRRAGHAVPECGFAAAACDNGGPSVVARRQSAPNGEARVSEASIPDRLAAAPPARREHVPLAILYMVGATLVFAASSAASKWLVATYPIGEVLFTRTAVALATRWRCSSCRRPGSRCTAPGGCTTTQCARSRRASRRPSC